MGSVYPLTFEDTPFGYAPASTPSIAGSPSGMTCVHIIRQFCSDFWGLNLHRISNFPGLCLWADPVGSLQRSPRFPPGDGGSLPPPNNSNPPLLDLRASGFGSSSQFLWLTPHMLISETKPEKKWQWQYWSTWVVTGFYGSSVHGRPKLTGFRPQPRLSVSPPTCMNTW